MDKWNFVLEMFEKFFLKNTIKAFTRGVWAYFINKINEKIEFELRNSINKLKIQLSEEDKTVSSRNLKKHYFEVFFINRKMDK